MTRFALTILLVFVSSGCTFFKPLPPKERNADSYRYKRCLSNNECPTGYRCERNFCEDIYHPRRDVVR